MAARRRPSTLSPGRWRIPPRSRAWSAHAKAAHIEASVGAAALALDDIALTEIDAIMDGAVPVSSPTPESV
jgi:hypothetical protein